MELVPAAGESYHSLLNLSGWGTLRAPCHWLMRFSSVHSSSHPISSPPLFHMLSRPGHGSSRSGASLSSGDASVLGLPGVAVTVPGRDREFGSSAVVIREVLPVSERVSE